MCGKNFAFWCCVLLLVVTSSSKSQKNSTNNEEKDDNLTVLYEVDANSTNYDDKMKTLRYDLYEKFNNNTQYDVMQYESRTTFTSREDDSIQYKLSTHSIQNHEDDKKMSMGSRMYSINANHRRNFTSRELYGNLRIEDKNDSTSHEFFQKFSKDSNESNIVPYEMCDNITCIPLCCPLGDRLVDNKCIPEKNKYFFPNVYGYTNDSSESESKRVDELFQLVVHDPCQANYRLILHEDYNDYMIFANGSLYLPYYKIFANSTSYCLAVVDGDKFKVIICSETFDEIFNTTTNNKISSINNILIYISPNIVCILLLLLTILIYSILPELRNAHGFMLRNYSGALCVAYIMWIVNFLTEADAVQYSACITVAFFTYYSFLTSTIWLTVMSFDLWWTFRGFCSLQRNVRQREKRKLVLYTIYTWGFSFIVAIICVSMDFISKDLPKILRPQFRAGNCWFAEREALALYYYGFKSVCVITSIGLSISTALKITRYEKDTGFRLTDSESKRYNDNKKWFNLYLKLFIVQFIIMGIKWFLKTALILFEDKSDYILHSINLMDVIQNICTFILLVWKKKIKRMLLKRFGCGLFPETRCGINATSSSTSTSTSGIAMQEKMNSCGQAKCHAKDMSDRTDL
ncbi:unnamed protein product [Lasius platythorax]|uniref:G-protein coupled receptors family 2 profile 2 domain-containing protein n=1 Tax=Lasius platythorax TaxID=488582 RepID=A0AAV2P3S7_9HYME